MMNIILISFGAAIGASLRGFITSLKIFDRFSLPYAVFAVNVTGALLMGVAMPLVVQSGLLYFMIIFGFLGGFTTYSAFSIEQLQLFQQREFKKLIKYTFMMIFFCLVSLALGLLIGVSIAT
ncbi:fluoride efflux transporter FluC [Salinicoccus hispanicus]|uniref:Fluoride-specific ion channel FluC n=1 Tax=Salinicoccus hispanicus TaxID=157225 RepID=A0A6N8U2D9_9STAP|nr:CrcB family protein [Salinicoccus hispanicus]MXQ50535.1 CrcB family protein [Salinicoccus hispanicus]